MGFSIDVSYRHTYCNHFSVFKALALQPTPFEVLKKTHNTGFSQPLLHPTSVPSEKYADLGGI